ncbi:MAG TPA: hypothetical protein VJ276_20670, partial [Thermoanaerobaculia bacterium]|nr:hypothetical protein [Thermoanaerobaculia bacterium]
MKKFLIIVGVVAALIGALAVYLAATTPKSSAGVRFPLSAAQRELLATVPQSADAFALIPTAAALEAKLRANPVTRDTVEKWTENRQLPSPWMIGGADLLAWRSGKQTRYLLRLDPVRAVIVRAYLMLSGEESLLLGPTGETPIDGAELARILALTDSLPAGDVLVVQRQGSRGAFPPIGRPAVTSAAITAMTIDVTSRAAGPSPPA